MDIHLTERAVYPVVLIGVMMALIVLALYTNLSLFGLLKNMWDSLFLLGILLVLMDIRQRLPQVKKTQEQDIRA